MTITTTLGVLGVIKPDQSKQAPSYQTPFAYTKYPERCLKTVIPRGWIIYRSQPAQQSTKSLFHQGVSFRENNDSEATTGVNEVYSFRNGPLLCMVSVLRHILARRFKIILTETIKMYIYRAIYSCNLEICLRSER